MPSSTSSSERERPQGSWRATWAVAVCTFLVATLAVEYYLRALGQRPSVRDDATRWALTRHSLPSTRSVLVFVGTSRLQLALSLDTVKAALPAFTTAQLAINGVPAEPVLEDLARDEEFRGVVIVDVDEWDVAWGDVPKLAVPYVEQASALWRAPGLVVNRWLATMPQEHLASLAIGGRVLAMAAGRALSPQPTWVVTDRDRVGYGDYSLASAAALRAKARARHANFDAPSLAPDAWLERARRLDSFATAIRGRGGDVVFVRLPVSGRLAELFAQHYPRDQYWNAWTRSMAFKSIHYSDVGGLQLVCPDEMHVDQRDQERFTSSLLDAIRQTGVLESRSSPEQRRP